MIYVCESKSSFSYGKVNYLCLQKVHLREVNQTLCEVKMFAGVWASELHSVAVAVQAHVKPPKARLARWAEE